MTSSSDKTQLDQPQHTVVKNSDEPPVLETLVLSKSKTDPITAKKQRQVCEGDVLNDRFELVELLGSGGMGAVYRARDLRQVEAGDEQPWLAVKIINSGFAHHEKSFTALQQETKKTQRLAHPNIVSVYDFDRDGSTAFMTMELLQGQSLDKVIQGNPNGLDKQQALDIIQQITQGINYAHKLGVVHADLKPANIFVTDDGRVKVLDFGIAQAIQEENPSFDAHSLGALTPAYASVNMLAGRRPQRQDDLYGLGCIFYSLLTGKHPYQKRKATEAEAANLVLKPIAGLPSFQWKALKSLLEFHPEKDLSIQKFEYGFFRSKKNSKGLYGIGIAAFLLMVLVAVLTVNWMSNQKIDELAELLSSAEVQSQQKAVGKISELEEQDQVLVLDSAREVVIQLLSQLNGNLSSADAYSKLEQRYSFLLPLYSDSSKVSELYLEFSAQKKVFLQSLEEEIASRIQQRNFHEGEPNFSDLVLDLTKVNPNSPVFKQHDIKSLLAKEIGVSLYMGEESKALSIVRQAGLIYSQDSGRFQAIIDRFQSGNKGSVMPVAPDASTENTLLSVAKLWQQNSVNNPQVFAEFMNQLKVEDEDLYWVIKSSMDDYVDARGRNYRQVATYYASAFPKRTSSVAVKKKDVCKAYFANRGKASSYRCRDSLTRSYKGPELVVIRGNRSVQSFAVSRTEISVSDFNVYCRLYKRCQPYPNVDKPISDISLKQAQGYARWLSKMTGKRYRLPTQKEWLLFAKNDSGIEDHNCIVNSAGRVIRGGELRAVDQGYSNSLGLVNVVGNVEEWVRSGSVYVAVGGRADHDIRHCSGYQVREGAEQAHPFRGFRLVRELG